MVLVPKKTYEMLRTTSQVHSVDNKDTGEEVINHHNDVAENTATTDSSVRGESIAKHDAVQKDPAAPAAPATEPVQVAANLIEQFPENYRFYAKRLLLYIKRHGRSVLGWSDADNSLVYRANPVTGSNIVALINHIFKTNRKAPTGIDRFNKGMAEIKVPKAYLKPYLLKPPGIVKKTKKTKWLKY